MRPSSCLTRWYNSEKLILSNKVIQFREVSLPLGQSEKGGEWMEAWWYRAEAVREKSAKWTSISMTESRDPNVLGEELIYKTFLNCILRIRVFRPSREKHQGAHSLPKKLSAWNSLLFTWEARSESKVQTSNWCSESLPRKHYPGVYMHKSSSLKVFSDYLVTSLCPPETSVSPRCPFILYPIQSHASISVLTPWFRTSSLLPWVKSSRLILP